MLELDKSIVFSSLLGDRLLSCEDSICSLLQAAKLIMLARINKVVRIFFIAKPALFLSLFGIFNIWLVLIF